MEKEEIILPADRSYAINFSKERLDNDFITIVSGLPRSGTSMMMKILDAGHMPILTDNIRKPDQDNPNGYYEFEGVKELEHDNSWLEAARGRAVKIVSPLLRYLNVDTHRYKIIFMLRDLDEILASQRKMADRLNHGKDMIKEKILKRQYADHLEEIKSRLEDNENIDVLYVQYANVINNPFSITESICTFLDIKLNRQAMIFAIDGSLYRQRITKSIIPFSDAVSGEGMENEVIMERLQRLGYL